jgi:glucosamine-6-phosphate deaminase
LAALAHAEIDWSRLEAFHMDEYIGLEAGSRKSFSYFLRVHLFDLVSPGTFHVLDGLAEPTSEAQRYAQLLRRAPLDLVCCGVGENGHIAFNDPANADFQDPDSVKEVALSEESRLQQVHDGMFDGVDAVPACALTVTVPALFSAQAISCAAPGPTKRGALDRMLHGPISIECPASILRQHTNCTLYTDTEGYG